VGGCYGPLKIFLAGALHFVFDRRLIPDEKRPASAT